MSDIAPVPESLARWAGEEPAFRLLVLYGCPPPDARQPPAG